MIKTVSLTAGTETKVEISGGYNVGVINRTTDMLYASRNSGIVAGADDVAAIPAGDSYVIRAADDTVYLLATAAGDVQLESIGAKEVFKIAAARSSSGGGEGGTVDDVARQAIASHANNTDIHLTAEDAIEAAATAISNPNLLINPDFKINQRGQTEYTSTTSEYSVDGWKIGWPGDITTGDITKSLVVEDGGVTLSSSGGNGYLAQFLECPENFFNKTFTVSVNIESISGTVILSAVGNSSISGTVAINDIKTSEAGLVKVTFTPEEIFDALRIQIRISNGGSVKVNWFKLELGSVATPFIPPDPATELAKCQRYYQIHTTGDIDPVDLRPSMATITDIRQREDGNYEYIAELW